jgi:HEAT repeat protein
MAGRGVEPVGALTVLVQYAHDPDETTRYWAVAGMALVGSDPTVQLLLKIFHDDPSPRVRETAGCGLAQAGMLTREQRRRAVPELVRYAGDASLDANTRTWVYQALHDITGANVTNDSVAWREWLSENGSN